MYKGTPVAVKVQRAGLKELFDTDLKNLKARRPPQPRSPAPRTPHPAPCTLRPALHCALRTAPRTPCTLHAAHSALAAPCTLHG